MKVCVLAAAAGGYIPVMLMRTSLANWTAVMFSSHGLGLTEAASCVINIPTLVDHAPYTC